ncbi:MAG: OmpP1/FadL family transporter [Bacteroidota bacterium]
MNRNITPRLLSALLAVALSGTAGAAGFQLQEQNASGIGNAYAGSAAVAENASTIFYNPAGMTQLQDREVSLGVTAVRPSFSFSNNGSTVPNLGPASLSGNGGDAGSWAYLPNAYLSWALSRDLYVGLGMGAPFGLMTEYDQSWLGAAQSIKFDIKTYNINPSVAYRVNDVLSLGAGVNWMRMDAEYVKRAAAATVAPLATLDASDDAWGWNVGALLNLSPATKLGLSYRSRVKQKLDGTLTVAGVTSFGAKADLTLPDTAILSATHKLNAQWEVLADVSWTGWSSVPKVDIVQKSSGATVQTLGTAFKDTWRVALGGNYQVNDALKLKFGVAYDQSPVPDAAHRLVSLPDNDRTWASLGAQWNPAKGSMLDLGVSYLMVKNTDINAVSTTSGTTVRGTYDSNVWIVGAQYSMAF